MKGRSEDISHRRHLTRQTNLCDKMFTPNYSSCLLEHKFSQKSYTDLDKVSPTGLYANETGIKYVGKDLRTLHLPPSGKRKHKGLPEQDRSDKRICLPTNLMKSSVKFLLKHRYDAHPFFPRTMYTANSNDDCKIPSALDNQMVQTPPPTRQINLCEEIFTPNYSSSPPEHKFTQKSSTDLDTTPLTELYAGQIGFRHLGNEPRALHFIDPSSVERGEKGSPEQDNFDKGIYLPTNLMKSSKKFHLKPRYKNLPPYLVLSNS